MSTLSEPPVQQLSPRRAAPPRRAFAREPLWRARWVLGTLVLLGISLAVVLWADTRPGYDPYGWLVWGHLTIHGKLDTNGAPSWKPLPFLFTVPYALAGHRAMWLWMVTSCAVSLSGPIFAARIAYRLTDPPRERRWVGWLAGAFAAVTLIGIRDYTHYIFSAQSDTMIVSLCLGMIDCHLYGRRRWAFVFGFLASLGRPEFWPMFGLYSLWAWRAVPQMRWLIAAGLLLIPVFWFGIPGLTSKSFFTAANIANKSPRALHQNKILGELDRFGDLHVLPVQLAALLAIALALVRRDRTVLVITAMALLWVIVEVAFVLHGWPGVSRYLFEPAGVMTALAGVAVGRILLDVPALFARLVPRVSGVVPQLGALAIVAAISVAPVPAAESRVKIERADLQVQRLRTKWINHLPGLIAQLGGPAHLFSCGKPTTIIGYQSVLAWELGSNVGQLFWTPHLGTTHPQPVVYFIPTPHAWKVVMIDRKLLPPSKQADCAKLNTVSLVVPPSS